MSFMLVPLALLLIFVLAGSSFPTLMVIPNLSLWFDGGQRARA